jgi:lysophospholipase L1-like esterase
MTSATAFQHWYYISGIDVMADASAKGVVAIGDSITDGRGTDNDKNNRWTDVMAARLQANAATANVATMNQGIGATNLIGSGNNGARSLRAGRAWPKWCEVRHRLRWGQRHL